MNQSGRYDELTDEQLQELNRICSGFEKSLRESNNPTIESQLAGASHEIQRPLFLELLELELESQVPKDELLDVSDYMLRFPDRKSDIHQVLASIVQRRSKLASDETNFLPASEKANSSGEPTTDHAGMAAGTRIGPYTLLQPIGEGGMGSVWMAEQKVPVRRTVALKIIKAGMDTREVIARFEAERQALALMNHPNIAKVLDAGATETGRPYFVMELVKGVPITRFCDKNLLPAKQRLKLFTDVCRGVQHAHQKGIIHRDLKPTNILVALHDGEPVVKVIDFGLAKATGRSLTEKTIFTALGQMVGTPSYMSPEQADAELDIDTRTDVYSLGVLLYELLTGGTPIDIKQLRSAGFAEIQRMIREECPPPMSHRLSSLGQDSNVVATKRATDAKRLTQVLRGDLDLIVMKSLEKDRTRRYETPSSFAADINRYLSNEPIEARPPSASYRLKKLIRRNKTAVLTMAAVGLALLIGTGVSMWQAMVASEQRDLAVLAQQAEEQQRQAADEQRDRAVAAETETKKRADELQVVSDFQAEMLAQIDPTEAGKLLSDDVAAKLAAALANEGVPDDEKNKQIDAFRQHWQRINATDTARDLIDRTILTPAVGAIDEQFIDQPIVDASLRNTLAKLYRDIGLYDASLPLQKAAVEKRRRELGDEHPKTLYSITNMGVLLQSMGKLDEAEPYYVESLEKRRRFLGEEHPDTMISINNMGFLLQSQGKLDEAEPFYREALEKRIRVLGKDDELTIASLSNMGFLLRAQGKLDEAEPFWREALERNRRVLGDEHPSTLSMINNLGFLLRSQGKLVEAEAYQLEALESFRRTLGESHPDTLIAMNNMGILLFSQGKLSEAEPYFFETLEKRKLVLGEDHPQTLTAIGNLAVLLQRQNKLSQAEPFFREALHKKRRLLGEEHPSTLNSIGGLGVQLYKQGKLDESEPYLREALEKKRRINGEDHPSTLASIGNLGLLLLEQEQLPEAELLLFEAMEKNQRVLGDEHSKTLISIIKMASLFNAQDKFAESIKLLVPIEAKSRKEFTDANAYRLADLLMNLGQARTGLAKDASDYTQAESNLLESHRIYLGIPTTTVKDTQDCTQALVGFYTAWNLTEPGQGYDTKAADWKVKLDTIESSENGD